MRQQVTLVTLRYELGTAAEYVHRGAHAGKSLDILCLFISAGVTALITSSSIHHAHVDGSVTITFHFGNYFSQTLTKLLYLFPLSTNYYSHS